MMKRIAEIAPAITVIAMFATAVIGFYAGRAVADHDESEKAHPNISMAIQANTAQIGLLKREAELRQVRTDENFDRSDKAQERILDALIRIEQKVDGQ